ncbi:hypothetical protein CQW23_12991 [Capsicum baccatum]|uniref:Uncharacterized protein n=1 Tax=Capsicum baccatum TaxID=33114 RepID=A0A2G2WU76_CAPBA|nr:hypothetical protein CQW23_12991 [Capsicum baccatum]
MFLYDISSRENIELTGNQIKETKMDPTLYNAAVEGNIIKDSEFEFPFNKAREIPLYLAAESGLREVLIDILNSYKQPTSSADPLNRTPMHAAVIQEHTVKMTGQQQFIFQPVQLLNRCPDCWEMLDSNGQNDLHEAILYSQANVVDYLLNSRKWDKLVEDTDNDGNTPLHLLASSKFWGYVPLELKDHPRAEKMSYKKENKTPFEVAVYRKEWMVDKDRIAPSLYHDFFVSFTQLGRRVLKLNQLDQ